MYKLIAIDLDGTLLNSYGEVSFENKKALQKAIEKGIIIVLASGRIGDSVENIAKEIGNCNYYISGNGSLLYNIKEEKLEYEDFMEKEKVLELVKICDENSIYYNIYTEDMVIAKALKYNVAFYNYENSKKNSENRTNINIVENVYEYIKQSQNKHFLKMTICDNNKIVFSSIMKKFNNIKGIDVLEVSHMSRKIIKEGTKQTPVEYFYTEITKKDADKWNSILKIIEKENIDKSEVIAIGDNMNDEKMIKYAGLGVAMGQSNPKIKQIADVVTDDNNNDGVAKVINKYVNKEMGSER